MKFELKTEKENYSNSFSHVFKIVALLASLIIFFDFALKLRIISRHYQTYYSCKLLTLEKSKSNFKKLSRLSNLKSKQLIWEFCKDFVK